MTVARFSFPAKTSELAALGQFIAAHCQDAKQVLIELAITEIVVNAIKHGQASRIELEVEDLGQAFKFLIKDDGLCFDPTKQTPQAMGELREGGYGLGIVQQVSDVFEHRFEQGQNHLSLQISKGDLT